METDEAQKLAIEILKLTFKGKVPRALWLPDPKSRYVDSVEHIADLIREYHRTQGILEK